MSEAERNQCLRRMGSGVGPERPGPKARERET